MPNHQNYKDLQTLYCVDEIHENCVDIDFSYAFICAMACSEFELQQWLPMLFVEGDSFFSNDQIASDFAQVVLAIYQQAKNEYQQNKPLILNIELSLTSVEEATVNFANGFLQALIMIDNAHLNAFVEDSSEAHLQQTCFLLLDKLATTETQDEQKLAVFEQLPSHAEIVALLPQLLSRYGAQCLAENHDE